MEGTGGRRRATRSTRGRRWRAAAAGGGGRRSSFVVRRARGRRVARRRATTRDDARLRASPPAARATERESIGGGAERKGSGAADGGRSTVGRGGWRSRPSARGSGRVRGRGLIAVSSLSGTMLGDDGCDVALARLDCSLLVRLVNIRSFGLCSGVVVVCSAWSSSSSSSSRRPPAGSHVRLHLAPAPASAHEQRPAAIERSVPRGTRPSITSSSAPSSS